MRFLYTKAVALSRSLFNWPPSPVNGEEKLRIIRSFAGSIPDGVFVETGTFRGDTLAELIENFERLHSIELSPELYQAACQRFQNTPKVTLHNGDSSHILHKLIPEINSRIVYWLDGHYSGEGTALGDAECPIVAEIKAIFDRNNQADVILIDDARLFGWRASYPSQGYLKKEFKKYFPNHHFEVRSDIICVYP